MKRSLVLAVLSLTVVGVAQASVLEIQFSGVDLTYNGTNLFDAVAGNTARAGTRSQADSLTTMSYLVDGVPVGTVTTSSIALDLYVKGLTNVPAAGGLVTTAGNGNAFGVDLLTGGSDPAWGLSMNIDKLSFFYTGNNVAISLAGQDTGLYSQSLPYGLQFDPSQPISIAFSSASLTNVTSAGGFLTGFNSSGTGNISGTLLPEPASLLLMTMGGLALLRRRKA